MAAGVLLPALEGSVAAQETFTRAQKQDIYLVFGAIGSKQIDYKTASGLVPISMDTTYLGGIGFGYHFSGKLSLRFETLFGNTTFRGKGPASGTSREVAMDSGMINLDWFILDRPVSPYITAGIGVQYIEAQLSNVSVPTAYWDPWWGYTVTSSYPTYSETDFVPSLGIGVRWDVNDRFFLKASVDSSWINYVNVSDTSHQIKYGLTFGAVY
jgi:opacity protein-like surface antigen